MSELIESSAEGVDLLRRAEKKGKNRLKFRFNYRLL